MTVGPGSVTFSEPTAEVVSAGGEAATTATFSEPGDYVVRVRAKKRHLCDDCGDCFVICPEPYVITPALDRAEHGVGPVILSGDCTNCGRCIDVCHADVFAVSTRFHNALPQITQERAQQVADILAGSKNTIT